MSNAPNTITSVRWSSLFPWIILVRAARVSLMVRVIALALAGVLITHAGWGIVGKLVLGPPYVPASFGWPQARPLAPLAGPNLVLPQPAGSLDVVAADTISIQAETIGGPLARGWAWMVEPFRALVHAESWRHWFGLLFDAAWTIIVWALFGG